MLEFKQASTPTRASVDQTEAYARDLADYHAATHGRQVVPILILTQSRNIALDFDPVVITGGEELVFYLLHSATPGAIILDEWLAAPYAPLPTLVAAARQIFKHKPLPQVHSALSQDIPGTLALVNRLIKQAEEKQQRCLILIGGVPGSGKTLLGLRLVYERSEKQGRGILLSGNGPLVQVLQDALESRVFVRDLHAFIRTYGMSDRVPNEHIVVFDEAQRAWSSDFMYYKRRVQKSEPQLLVVIGERLANWAALVGLIGEGQEIFSGEEAGIGQWRDAILESHANSWTVHAPPSLSAQFVDCNVEVHERLDLTISLRSRRAQELHEWVGHLLNGGLALAAQIAARIATQKAGFPLYVTRDLEAAKGYVQIRYAGEPDKRYGVMVAAHARVP